MPGVAHARRAGRRGRGRGRRRRHARPARQLGDGCALPPRALPAGHGPGGDARPDGADAGQDERRRCSALQVGQAVGALATETAQRHRGRAAAGRPTGPSRCCRPTSRRSPRASASTSTRCASTSPSARPPGCGCSPRCRGSAPQLVAAVRDYARDISIDTDRDRVGAAVGRPSDPTALQSGAAGPAVHAPSPARPSAPRWPGSRPTSRSSRAGSTSSPTGPPRGAPAAGGRARRGGPPPSRHRRPGREAFTGLVGLELRPRRLRDAAEPVGRPRGRRTASTGRDARLGAPRRRADRRPTSTTRWATSSGSRHLAAAPTWTPRSTRSCARASPTRHRERPRDG